MLMVHLIHPEALANMFYRVVLEPRRDLELSRHCDIFHIEFFGRERVDRSVTSLSLLNSRGFNCRVEFCADRTSGRLR